MSTKHSQNNIVQNTAWLTFSEFGSRLLAFIVIVWLANYLGSTQYGELAYAFAVANLLVIISDFGATTFLIKELARDLKKTTYYYQRLFGLKLVLSSITIVLMISAGIIMSSLDLYIIIAGGIAIVLNNIRIFIEGFYRAHQRMHLESITKVINGASLAIVTSVLILNESTLKSIVTGYMVAAIIGVTVSFAILFWKIGITNIRPSLKQTKILMIAMWPFALSIAFNYLFNYMDSAMLGALGYTTETGWYNAAYKPIFFLTAVAGMIISAFFPVISDKFKHAKEQVKPTVERLFRTNMIIAIPMTIGGIIVAGDIIEMLYIPEYQPAALAFQLLLLSTGLIYFWAVFGNSLQACDHQKIYVIGFSWAALINTILNITLIPFFTLYGAAVATILTQLFLAFYMYNKFKKVAAIPIIPHIWKPLFAASVMAIIIYFTNMSIWVTVPLGAFVYMIFLILIKGLTRQEIITISKLIKK